MKNKTLRTWMLGIALAFSSFTHAQTLVEYFDGLNPSASNQDTTGHNAVSGLLFSPATRLNSQFATSGCAQGGTFTGPTLQAPSFNILASGGVIVLIAPAPGTSLTLREIKLGLRRSGTGAQSAHIGVSTNPTNLSSWTFSPTFTVPSVSCLTVPNTVGNWDLNDITIANDTIAIAIWGWGASSGTGSFQMHTLDLIGDVTCVTPPTIQVTNPHGDFCLEDAPAALTTNPTGGTFSGPGVNPTTGVFDPANAGGPGTKRIYYTRVSGPCTSVDSVDIVVNPPANANILTGDTTVCVNSLPFTLTATNPGGNWFVNNSPLGSSQFNPSAMGVTTSNDVSYRLTDPITGCFGSDSIIVDLSTPPALMMVTNDTSICESGINFSIISTAIGSGTYSGSPAVNPTTGVFNVSAAPIGLNRVYHTIGFPGCTTRDSVDIIVNATLNATIITSDTALCSGAGSFTLTAVTPGGNWFVNNTAIGSATFDPSVPTYLASNSVSYRLDDPINGCDGADSITVTIGATPTASITTPDSAVCANGAPFQIIATPAGGTFYGSTGVTNTGLYTAAAATNNPTDVVIYRYTDNGCSDTAFVSFTILAIPTVNITDTSDVCNTTSSFGYDFTASGAPILAFSWGTTGSILIDQNSGVVSTGGTTPGTYVIYLDVTDGLGCMNTDTVYLDLNAPPTINFVNDDEVCVNAGVLTLDATPTGGAFSGNFVTNGAFDPAVAASGDHWVYYTVNSGGCLVNDSLEITVDPLPTAAFTATVNGATVTFTASNDPETDDGSFDFGDGNSAIGTAATHTYTANGTYTVTYIASNDCGTDVATQQVTISNLSTEQPPANSVKIYPNPTTQFVSVTLSGTEPATVFITDITGKLHSMQYIQEQSTCILDVTALTAGVYTVTIQYANGNQHHHKLVKQ